MRRNLSSLSTGGGLAAFLLWSTTFALARSLSEQVGPLTAGAAVYLIGGTFGLVRLACSAKPATRLLKLSRSYLLGCGGLFIYWEQTCRSSIPPWRMTEPSLSVSGLRSGSEARCKYGSND